MAITRRDYEAGRYQAPLDELPLEADWGASAAADGGGNHQICHHFDGSLGTTCDRGRASRSEAAPLLLSDFLQIATTIA